MAGTLMVDIGRIRLDGGTQMRVEINLAKVVEYAEEVKKLPPLEVVSDDKDNLWLWDGFHRYHAHKRAGNKVVPVHIHRGTQRDAVKLALSANKLHGLYRSNADKRLAVTTALADAEWGKLSNVKIAELCGVTEHLVRTIKQELIDSSVSTVPSTKSRFEASGDSANEDFPRGEGTGPDMASGSEEEVIPGTDSAPVEELFNDPPPPTKEQVEPIISAPARPVALPPAPPPPPPVNKSAPKEPEKPKNTHPTDQVGTPIEHAHVLEAFAARGEFTSLATRLSRLKGEFEALAELAPHIGHWAARRLKQFNAAISNARSEVDAATPYAVCRYCGGRKCEACKQTGWMPLDLYTALPSELKATPKSTAA